MYLDHCYILLYNFYTEQLITQLKILFVMVLLCFLIIYVCVQLTLKNAYCSLTLLSYSHLLALLYCRPRNYGLCDTIVGVCYMFTLARAVYQSCEQNVWIFCYSPAMGAAWHWATVASDCNSDQGQRRYWQKAVGDQIPGSLQQWLTNMEVLWG